tara:strand:+ start:2406 stop:3683 length:1278 start_codon:yes stop_codon:yes gene_type:complete
MQKVNFSFENLLLFFFPISLILGSAILNLTLIASSIYFINYSFKNNLFYFRYSWVKIFFTFIVFVLIASFFSNETISAFKNGFSQLRFILFSLFIALIDFNKIAKNFISLLTLIILFVCIDVNIQFIFGYDLFGYPSEGYKVALYEPLSHWKDNTISPGRLSGPFGSELIPGAFIACLSPPLIFYFVNKIKLSSIKYCITKIFIILVILQSVTITGERLAFLMTLSSIFISTLIIFNFKKTLISYFLISIILILSFNFIDNNNFYKKRWVNAYNISQNIGSSSYGRIYYSSYKIWQNNKIFGVGLKNYRTECKKIIDPKPNSKHVFCSPTHPHNLYLELLSETGLIGFFIFLSFYFSLIFFLLKRLFHKNLVKEKYFYFAIGSLFYLIFKLLPLPSGSVFSTWNASFFWLHLGLCLCFLLKKKYK